MDDWFIEKFNTIAFKNWLESLHKNEVKTVLKKITKINLLLAQDRQQINQVKELSKQLMVEIYDLNTRIHGVMETLAKKNKLEINDETNSFTILSGIMKDVEKSLRAKTKENKHDK